MLKHGYIVNTILETVIIPVIKNKSEDATDNTVLLGLNL